MQYKINTILIVIMLICVIGFSSSHAALTGYWKFDDVNDDLAIDMSGFGNDGVINSAIPIQGYINNALNFDGNHAYINIPNNEVFNAWIFTVSAWLNLENDTNPGAFIRKVGNWHIRTNCGQLEIVMEGGDIIKSGYNFPTNQWHHYIIVVNNFNKKVSFFVDGEQTGDVIYYSNGFSLSDGDLIIGRYDSNYGWNGSIDDLRFYDEEFSSEEIQALYVSANSPFNPDTDQSLIGYWKFDEQSGEIVNDSSSINNNGIITNSERVSGLMEGALSFDGLNSYVEVPAVNEYNSEVFTASVWLYHESLSRTCAYMRRSGGWHIRTSGGQWDIVLESGSIIRSGYYFPGNEWHHYAVTVDNINKSVRFFVDGRQYGITHYYENGFSSSNNNRLFIGQYSSGYRFKGRIDDVRLFNRSLRAEEIMEIYHLYEPPVDNSEQNLIGHWKFDDEDLIAKDSSEIENNGEIINAEITDGQIDQGLLFDGVTSFVEIPQNDLYNANVFTISSWLYHDNGTRTCAYMRRSGGWHIRTSNKVWDIVLEGGQRISSGYTFPDKKWHHYAVTVDNINNTVIFFVDGKQFGNIHEYNTGFSESNGALYIGQYSQNYRWKGGIDDVKFYNEALNPEKIYSLYIQGKKLAGHWKFDEENGNIAYDSSGNEKNGLINNAQRIEGPINGAISFDGVNDYVECPNSETYNNQIFTTAAWLYHENGDRTCAYMRRVGAWHIRTSNRVWDIVLEGGQRVSSGYYFPDARWHHYAVSINNINKTITFYVDGKQFGDVHNYTNGFENAAGPVYIGQYSSGYRWHGGIDDVRYYNTNLKEDEIFEIYKQGQSLVGNWTFDDINMTAKDSSDFNNQGEAFSINQIDGVINSAIELDGVNSYIEVQASDVFNAQVFTAAAWLYHESLSRTCAYMRQTGAWHIRTSGRQWDIVLEGGQRITSGYYFPENEWHHYAVIVDNINKTVKFYVDGEQFGDIHQYENGFSNSNGSFYIGQYSSNYRFKGGIDDVRFYKKAISAEEIEELYLIGQNN